MTTYSPGRRGLSLGAGPSVGDSVVILSVVRWRSQAAADERPTAQRGICLWLLYFYPDQVHRPPLRGPLIRSRRGPSSFTTKGAESSNGLCGIICRTITV